MPNSLGVTSKNQTWMTSVVEFYQHFLLILVDTTDYVYDYFGTKIRLLENIGGHHQNKTWLWLFYDFLALEKLDYDYFVTFLALKIEEWNIGGHHLKNFLVMIILLEMWSLFWFGFWFPVVTTDFECFYEN